jgi:hypothetical protein
MPAGVHCVYTKGLGLRVWTSDDAVAGVGCASGVCINREGVFSDQGRLHVHQFLTTGCAGRETITVSRPGWSRAAVSCMCVCQ